MIGHRHIDLRGENAVDFSIVLLLGLFEDVFYGAPWAVGQRNSPEQIDEGGAGEDIVGFPELFDHLVKPQPVGTGDFRVVFFEGYDLLNPELLLLDGRPFPEFAGSGFVEKLLKGGRPFPVGIAVRILSGKGD